MRVYELIDALFTFMPSSFESSSGTNLLGELKIIAFL